MTKCGLPECTITVEHTLSSHMDNVGLRAYEKVKLVAAKRNKKPAVDLRDYFMAAALTGICANSSVEWDWTGSHDRIVKMARMIADEMLIERVR